LKPGIASFSVITGNSTTISKNHTNNAATHKRVDRSVTLFGGNGNGFDSGSFLKAAALSDCGTGGSGFEWFCKSNGLGATRLSGAFGMFSVLKVFGGTGGPSSCVCNLRLRNRWSLSSIPDMTSFEREAKGILSVEVVMLGRSWERQRTNIRRGRGRI
jgi:hypothetical protein